MRASYRQPPHFPGERVAAAHGTAPQSRPAFSKISLSTNCEKLRSSAAANFLPSFKTALLKLIEVCVSPGLRRGLGLLGMSMCITV